MDFNTVETQIDSIREIFDEARAEDGLNTDDEMLYSYYFIDEDADKLEKLGDELEKRGFDFIGVFELADEETDEVTGEYLLHIDRVESHTPASLAERNVEFQKLAEEYSVASYDGWEFGEVDGEEDEEEEEEE